MTHDYLDRWLRENRRSLLASSATGGPIPWGAQDTDPNWEWDSETAAECGRAAAGTGEPIPYEQDPMKILRRPDRE